MPSFWKHVITVLDQADLILEILDARFIDQTRHREIESKIQQRGKQILYVINKCDLADQTGLRKAQHELQPSVFISSINKLGTTILRKKILELSHGKPVVVAVVGYPNVGKSSVINALAGRRAARTSAESGFTKGLQKIRVDARIMLLDTPGVFPRNEKDQQKYGTTGAVDYGKIKDAEIVAITLIQQFPKQICSYYNIKEQEPEEILDAIARKFKRLRKGGEVDAEATARLVLKDWQTGRIRSTRQ